MEITGLRNPCTQIDDYQQGLLKHVTRRDDDSNIVRKAGIMGILRAAGAVRAGDQSRSCFPDPHRPLERL